MFLIVHISPLKTLIHLDRDYVHLFVIRESYVIHSLKLVQQNVQVNISSRKIIVQNVQLNVMNASDQQMEIALFAQKDFQLRIHFVLDLAQHIIFKFPIHAKNVIINVKNVCKVKINVLLAGAIEELKINAIVMTDILQIFCKKIVKVYQSILYY